MAPALVPLMPSNATRPSSSSASSRCGLMRACGLPSSMAAGDWARKLLASDAPGSASAFSNRGVDFTNRAADINPEDIETMVVLKGPEAAALYGIDAAWHILPLLHVELTGLARITREPFPSTLTPSDTYVVDARVFGDHRGFHYAVEGAYELGKVASYGTERTHQAFAFAARVGLETSLPAHLAFNAEGAYATGDDGTFDGTQKRFDPLFPDQRAYLSPMSAFAWSNLIMGGGNVSARPLEELSLTLERLKQTQKQLVMQEKLASLGVLTSGIAHEIRNPLNFVNNFAESSIGLAQELSEEIARGEREAAERQRQEGA